MKYIILIFPLLSRISKISSQIPNKISYQGLLTGSSGATITDERYELKFELFKTQHSGSPLWSKMPTEVHISRSSFNVIICSLVSLPNIFRLPLHLEITYVSGPNITIPITFSPRSELTSSTSAFQVDTAIYAKAAQISGSVGGDLTGFYQNSAITANAMTSTKILDETIGSVDIRDTTIITFKIEDVSITTSKIASNAVDRYANAYRAEYNSWNRSSDWQSISGLSVSLTTTGVPVLIMYSAGGFSSYHSQSDDVQLIIAIFRGANIIANNRKRVSDYDGTANKGTGSISLQYLNFPPAETHTYEIKLLWDLRDEPLYQNAFTPNHGSNSLTVIELKR